MIVVRYQSFAANAVLTHRFESVATCSSQAGGGYCWQRVVRYSRCTNLFGPFKAARRFICSLRQFRQEPRSRFAYRFHSFVAPAFHEQKQTTKEFGNVRQVIGGENEYR
jgi:hypothetical protein